MHFNLWCCSVQESLRILIICFIKFLLRAIYTQYMSKIILCWNFQKYIYMPVDRRVSWKEFFPVANKSNCNISLRLHMYNCREGSIYHIMGTPTWGRTLLSYAAPAMSYRGFKHRGNLQAYSSIFAYRATLNMGSSESQWMSESQSMLGLRASWTKHLFIYPRSILLNRADLSGFASFNF